jgi:hypothetical protein
MTPALAWAAVIRKPAVGDHDVVADVEFAQAGQPVKRGVLAMRTQRRALAGRALSAPAVICSHARGRPRDRRTDLFATTAAPGSRDAQALARLARLARTRPVE